MGGVFGGAHFMEPSGWIIRISQEVDAGCATLQLLARSSHCRLAARLCSLALRTVTWSTAITICHRTNSNSNPYVEITPNVHGVLNGHAKSHGADLGPDAEGPAHQVGRHHPLLRLRQRRHHDHLPGAEQHRRGSSDPRERLRHPDDRHAG